MANNKQKRDKLGPADLEREVKEYINQVYYFLDTFREICPNHTPSKRYIELIERGAGLYAWCVDWIKRNQQVLDIISLKSERCRVRIQLDVLQILNPEAYEKVMTNLDINTDELWFTIVNKF